MLEMTYFRAESVQLIASRSDSELEVQRYIMNKNSLTVDCEKPEVGFFKSNYGNLSFWFLNFEVDSVWFLENWKHFHLALHTPSDDVSSDFCNSKLASDVAAYAVTHDLRVASGFAASF